MKSLIDHGNDFWKMFPSDGRGGIVLSEPLTNDATTQQPDDEVKEVLESLGHTSA